MKRLVLAVALGVTGIPSLPAESPVDERLVVAESADTFRLTVPVSRLVMTIPRANLTVVRDPGSGAASSPRYFHLEDSTRGIIISGWFEPDNLYRGIKELWKGETAAWKKKRLPKPRNESFTKVGKWEVVLYGLEFPSGSNTHVRAEWVELGTWIDVHISVTTGEPIAAARATAMDMLRSLRVDSAP